MRSLHIAILDLDVPVPTVYAARGLYSTQFRTLLQSAATRLNNTPYQLRHDPLTIHTSSYDTVGGCFPPLECLRTTPPSHNNNPTTSSIFPPIDAILLTGSSASAYDIPKNPWIPALETFLRTVHTHYPLVKLFGSCFGHQVIAQALLPKYKVCACPQGYEVGISPILLNEAFTSSFPGASARLTVPKMMKLQLVHGDWVVPASGREIVLPAPWMNIGQSAQCPIQGLYVPSRVLTYQGHFEFDVFVNRETILEFARRAKWGDEKVERYLGLIDLARGEGEEDEDDSKVAAEMAVMFFAGEDGVSRL